MKKKIIKSINYFCIFLIFIILLQFPQKSYSKYQTSLNSNNSQASIASFIFFSEIEKNVPLTINESLYPGIYYEYNFTVQNFNENLVSDITLEYSINISRTNNLPIDIKIYRNNELIDYSKTNTFILNKNIKTLDNYKIVIQWSEYNNDYNYANLSDNVSLNILTTQVD